MKELLANRTKIFTFHQPFQHALSIVFLIVVFGLPHLFANEQIDTIHLKNGDRISGRVLSLKDGKLTVQTPYAGRIQILWEHVISIDVDRQVQIVTASGMTYQGRVHGGKEGQIVIDTGKKREVIPRFALQGIEEPESTMPQTFWDRLQGNLDVGYSLARGNSHLNQSSLSFNSSFDTSRYKITVDLASIFSRQDNSPATSRHSASVRTDFSLGPAAFSFVLGNFERDERQRLNLRSNIGGGFGWTLYKSPTSELALLGGITYTNEQFRRLSPEEEPDRSSGEGLTQLNFKTQLLGRIPWSTQLSFHPNVVILGRYRVSFDSTLRMPLGGPFSWSVRLYDRFDSEPLVRAVRNDYGLITSLGFSF